MVVFEAGAGAEPEDAGGDITGLGLVEERAGDSEILVDGGVREFFAIVFAEGFFMDFENVSDLRLGDADTGHASDLVTFGFGFVVRLAA